MKKPLGLIIEEIRLRPAMYLHESSVYALKDFVTGFTLCVLDNVDVQLDVQSKTEFWGTFGCWLAQEKKITVNVSWADIINLYCADKSKSLDVFFRFYDKYLMYREENDMN